MTSIQFAACFIDDYHIHAHSNAGINDSENKRGLFETAHVAFICANGALLLEHECNRIALERMTNLRVVEC